MDKRITNPVAKFWGRQVRTWRERSGLTADDVGVALRISPHTLISWERGARIPHLDTIRQLDETLKADGMLLVGMEDLAAGGPRFPGGFSEYPDVEADCVSLNAFSTMAIPGLLQTEEYAQEAISSSVPPLDENHVANLVAARMGRQVLLGRRPAPVLGFVIEESVLRRPIGGKAAHRRQLARIVECAQMRHVTVQVMAADAEEHCGLEGPMILLRTGDGCDVAYIEGQAGGDWVDDAEQVAVIAQRHGIIRTQAERAAKSIELIETIAGEL